MITVPQIKILNDVRKLQNMQALEGREATQTKAIQTNLAYILLSKCMFMCSLRLLVHDCDTVVEVTLGLRFQA